MAMPTRNLDPASPEGIAKRVDSTITTLRQGASLSKDVKIELADLLEKMKPYVLQNTTSAPKCNSPESNTNEETTERINNLEKKIDELKASLALLTESLMNPKTWAQVASAAPPPQQQPNSAKREQLAEAKCERATIEVTLTAKDAPDETKNKIINCHPKEVTERCQEAINAMDLASKPKVIGINTLANNGLRLQFKTASEAQEVQKTSIDWAIAYEGLKPHKLKYGIVMHAIRTDAINLLEDHEDTIREWEAENEGLKIIKVTALRRKHTPTATRSLIVFTEDKEAANNVMKRGFIVDSLKHRKLQRYAPHLYINQCYKCYGFGHKAAKCNQKQKCGQCANEEHTTKDCSKTSPHQCVNCKGDHEAWHIECPARTTENTRLNTLRKESSHFFA